VRARARTSCVFSINQFLVTSEGASVAFFSRPCLLANTAFDRSIDRSIRVNANIFVLENEKKIESADLKLSLSLF